MITRAVGPTDMMREIDRDMGQVAQHLLADLANCPPLMSHLTHRPRHITVQSDMTSAKVSLYDQGINASEPTTLKDRFLATTIPKAYSLSS